jgi:opacity protein-like surface antigen
LTVTEKLPQQVWWLGRTAAPFHARIVTCLEFTAARSTFGTDVTNLQSPGAQESVGVDQHPRLACDGACRVGYVWSPGLLFFATGGGAWGRSTYSSADVFPGGCPLCGATSFSKTASGYVVGAGMDWAPWRNNWIIRAEYLYYNLSGATATSVFPGTTNPVWNNISIQSARIGVAYKFW